MGFRDPNHKLNHNRKAGPHGGARRPDMDEKEEIKEQLDAEIHEAEIGLLEADGTPGKLQILATTAQLDREGVGLYYAACDTDEHSGGPEVVTLRINRGELNLWDWQSPRSRCVLITHLASQPDGSQQIFVDMLAGTNASADYNEIVDALAHVGEAMGNVTDVLAWVKPELWEAFKRHGAHAEERYVVIGRKVG